jgi:hypothetical protein
LFILSFVSTCIVSLDKILAKISASTIDHWRSWCKGWFLWPTPYTYKISATFFLCVFSVLTGITSTHMISWHTVPSYLLIWNSTDILEEHITSETMVDFQQLHSVLDHMIDPLITTAVRTSNPTNVHNVQTLWEADIVQ